MLHRSEDQVMVGKKLVNKFDGSPLARVFETYQYLVDGDPECKGQPEVVRHHLVAIRELMLSIKEIDERVDNLLAITQTTVEDARNFKNAMLSTSEGRELVDYLCVVRPDMASALKRSTIMYEA